MKEPRVPLVEILSYIMKGESQRCAAYPRRVFDKLDSTPTRIGKRRRGREIVMGWTMGRLCTVVGRDTWKVKQLLL